MRTAPEVQRFLKLVRNNEREGINALIVQESEDESVSSAVW